MMILLVFLVSVASLGLQTTSGDDGFVKEIVRKDYGDNYGDDYGDDYGDNYGDNSGGGSSGPKCVGPIDLIFVVDSSGGMRQEGYDNQIQILSEIARSFRIGDEDTRIAAVAYSSFGEKLFDLKDNDNADSVAQALLDAPYRRSLSKLDKALHTVVKEKMFRSENGGRDDAEDVVLVVLSDKTTRPEKSLKASLVLKKLGVKIYTIVLDDSCGSVCISRTISSKLAEPINYEDKNVDVTDSDIELLCQLAGGSLDEGNNDDYGDDYADYGQDDYGK